MISGNLLAARGNRTVNPAPFRVRLINHQARTHQLTRTAGAKGATHKRRRTGNTFVNLANNMFLQQYVAIAPPA